jgi:hypothetical protein
MTLKRTVLATFICALLAAGAPLLAAEKESKSLPSLGDLARKLREERAEAAKRPDKVYTNENLPERPAPGALTVAAGMASGESNEAAVTETSTETVPAKGATKRPAAPETPAADAEAGRGEAYFRARAAAIRSQTETQRRQLAVLEQKLSQGQMNFHDDPQKTLVQESTPEFYSEVNKLREDIKKKKEEIAASEKAMEDLQDELRREGGHPAWIR